MSSDRFIVPYIILFVFSSLVILVFILQGVFIFSYLFDSVILREFFAPDIQIFLFPRFKTDIQIFRYFKIILNCKCFTFNKSKCPSLRPS